MGRAVVGRTTELATLEGLLTELSAGRGRALLVRGEAGIGKTTLLDLLAGWGGDRVTILRARGVQTEAEIAFSGLSDLLAPVVGDLGALPDPQAAALAAALALGPPQPGDRLAVSVATRGLLRAAGRGRPVLAVADDVQWLDGPSREAVLYAARRAEGPVAFVIAARDSDGGGQVETGLPEVTLGRLEREQALAVLAQAAPDLAGPVAQAVADAAAGNPLALMELPGTLSPQQRSGSAELEVPLAPGTRLQATFERRLDACEERARRALLVAAAYQGEDLRTLTRACALAGTDVELLTRVEQHGLVRVEGDRVAFGHPLIRGGVYRAAAAEERRAAHRALAGVLEGESRAWHLAAAAVGPDEQVAAELEQAAEAAAARRGYGSAVVGLERAARLSPDTQAFARRMLAAGKAALAGGLAGQALALLTEASGATTDPRVRAQVAHLRGTALRWRGEAQNAIGLLAAEAEAVAPHDPRQAAAMLADAAATSTTIGECRRALPIAERAAALLGDGAATRPCARVCWRCWGGRWSGAALPTAPADRWPRPIGSSPRSTRSRPARRRCSSGSTCAYPAASSSGPTRRARPSASVPARRAPSVPCPSPCWSRPRPPGVWVSGRPRRPPPTRRSRSFTTPVTPPCEGRRGRWRCAAGSPRPAGARPTAAATWRTARPLPSPPA